MEAVDVSNQDLVIPRRDFGKDHFSMLAYVFSRTTSNPKGFYEGRLIGELDPARIRINEKKRPMHVVRTLPWKSEWGTRKKDGTHYPDHDDIDVLNDLEVAGLILFINTAALAVALTEEGSAVAKDVIGWKALGGQFINFPDQPMLNEVYWREQAEGLWFGIAFPKCMSVVGTIRKMQDGMFEWSARTMLNTRPTVGSPPPKGIAASFEESRDAVLKLLKETNTLR